MRGHIARKGSRYYVVVDAGRDPETGKRRQRWHAGFKSKKEAERALPRILSQIEDGTYIAPSRQTVADFLAVEWLPAIEHRVRPGTHALYQTIVAAHLIPHVGEIHLQALKPSQLNRLYATLLEKGRRDGRGLAPKSVRNAHTTLHRALSDAVRWGRVARNVAEFCDPPKVKSSEMKTWDARELRSFLDHARDHRLYAAWLLAATTGMRRGEILGLHWRDVDLDAGRLSVRCSLVLVAGTPTWSEPKTAKGRRSVPLPSETVTALRAHRAGQLEERLLMGPGYDDADLVFCEPDGPVLHPATFERTWKRLVEAARAPAIRLHDVRHTFATLALRAGVHPKVVSEILGHANISITLDTYSHAIPAMQEEAADRVAALVFRVPG